MNLRRALLCLVVGGVLSFWQLGPQRGAWWGLMDDGEALRFRAPATALALSDVPAVIASTEVGQFGTATRYRPVYYTVRVLEMWAWGASPARWYVARIVFFGLTLAGAAFALWVLCGGWMAIAGLALLLGEWYWGDIWAHLGPAEQYAAMGTAALAIGVALARRGAGAAGLWMVAIGTAVAAGSKENFAVLMLPLLLVAWRERHRHPRTALAAVAIPGALVALVVAAVFAGMRHATVDIYGNPVDSHTRLGWMVRTPGLVLGAAWVVYLGFVVMVRRAKTKPDSAGRLRDATADLAQIFVLASALVASQMTFYPQWPTHGSRYDFPGMLAFELLVIGGAIFVRRWLQRTGRGGLTRAFEVAVVVGCVALGLRHGDLSAHRAARINAERTQALRKVLERVRDVSLAQPNLPVVLDVRSPAWTEPQASIVTLLAEIGCRCTYHVLPQSPALGARASMPASRSMPGDSLRVAGRWVRYIGSMRDAAPASDGRVAVLTVHDYDTPTFRYEQLP